MLALTVGSWTIRVAKPGGGGRDGGWMPSAARSSRYVVVTVAAKRATIDRRRSPLFDQPHRQAARRQLPRSGQQTEDPGDVAARLGVRRYAAAGRDRRRAGVVGGERERDR